MTDLDLRAGKLEQSCPDCGRWEAAGSYCSWCGRATGAADRYRNGDTVERARRLPPMAPANPPSEYRRTHRPDYGDGWPPAWGPNPYQQAARTRGTPVNRPSTSPSADMSRPTTRRADEPDLAGGLWEAAASRDADRQPAGSPDSIPTSPRGVVAG